MTAWALRELRRSAGRYAASVAVVAVVTAFAVLLITAIDAFTDAARAQGADVGATKVMLAVVGAVFLGIAVVVAVIVVSNTFSTIAAGRIKDIAVLRLIGATGKQVRRTALVDGSAVGAVGALVGIGSGLGIGAIGVELMRSWAHLTVSFPWSVQLVVVPFAGAVVATVLAAIVGVREVSGVSPSEAARSLPDGRRVSTTVRRRRIAAGLVLGGLGVLFLVGGVLIGYATPLGLLVAFFGGLFSSVGVVLSAPVILPPLVSVLGRLVPRAASPRLAAANLRHDSIRTSRTVLAVMIGVTVLTMFQVAGQMAVTSFRNYAGPAQNLAEVQSAIRGMLIAVDALTSFSVVVAVIGLASTLAISVLQRRRELGTLRAVGFTGGQARSMLLTESLLVAGTGAVGGLVLGSVYGWVGAVSVYGKHASRTLELPWLFVLAVAAGALLLGVVASLAPGRRASRVPPAVALMDI
ncbi:FtsX-like permease family protein [Cellulomonas sp. SG140]|uniref:FtsX-like permease family protein n=1 Tax=Cellulomonas sp. SG140 TaxID=2976536 RepID=UPI0021E7BFBB|nr:FtsX-like permease family protein [Cellulomonas sp. SG140]